MTREEHMAWCKARALEYLPNDPFNAIMSMASDVRKHPETNTEVVLMLCGAMVLNGRNQSAKQVREFIEGFN